MVNRTISDIYIDPEKYVARQIAKEEAKQGRRFTPAYLKSIRENVTEEMKKSRGQSFGYVYPEHSGHTAFLGQGYSTRSLGLKKGEAPSDAQIAHMVNTLGHEQIHQTIRKVLPKTKAEEANRRFDKLDEAKKEMVRSDSESHGLPAYFVNKQTQIELNKAAEKERKQFEAEAAKQQQKLLERMRLQDQKDRATAIEAAQKAKEENVKP